MRLPAPADPLAAIVYESPGGAEGIIVTPTRGPIIPFGRGGHCPIRFGYGTALDRGLSRQAGAFIVAGWRLTVECPLEGGTPLQVRADGRPPVELSAGEIYAPGTIEFDVIVRAERNWTITVRIRSMTRHSRGVVMADDPTTNRQTVELTPHEREVLGEYLAPLRAGKLEPATHTVVAKNLNYSSTKVRCDLYNIWSKMIAGGMDVPDFADKRVAVTRAALAYGITCTTHQAPYS